MTTKRVDRIGNVREVGKPLYAINGETADIARYGNSPTRSGLTSAIRRSRQRPRSFDVPVTRTPSPPQLRYRRVARNRAATRSQRCQGRELFEGQSRRKKTSGHARV